MLRHHDAYNVDHRVEELLDGLGFARRTTTVRWRPSAGVSKGG